MRHVHSDGFSTLLLTRPMSHIHCRDIVGVEMLHMLGCLRWSFRQYNQYKQSYYKACVYIAIYSMYQCRLDKEIKKAKFRGDEQCS